MLPRLLITSILLLNILLATPIQTTSGWNLIGSNKDNIQIATTFATCNSVWSYNDGWKAISPNDKLTSSLSKAKIPALDVVNAGDGFWINCNSSLNVTLDGTSPLNKELNINKQGWHLKSLKGSNSVDPIEFFKNSDITSLWKYTTNGWEAYSPNTTIANALTNAKITTLETLNPNEGFWINASGEITLSEALNPFTLAKVIYPETSTNAKTMIESSCGTTGGVGVYTGFDKNDNGILDENEYESETPAIICHGKNGTSSLVHTASASSSQCSNGGIVLFTGIDTDGDGGIDTNEQTSSSVICNGSDGAKGDTGADGTDGINGSNGSNALNSLVRTDSATSSQCANGGIAIYTGLDSNKNGILDTNEQNSNPQLVCNGSDGQDGEKGEKGDTGAQGATGVAGEDGEDVSALLNPIVYVPTSTLSGSINLDGLFKTLYKAIGYGTESLWVVSDSISASITPPTPGSYTHDNVAETFDPLYPPFGAQKIEIVNNQYSVENIPSGIYSLIYVDGLGKGTKIDSIVVDPGTNKVQNITQVTQTGSVTLKLASLSGTNIAGAIIRLNETDTNTTTDSNGIASFENLPEGTYSLTVTSNGYVSKYMSFTVSGGNQTDLQTIELNSQKGTIQGSVQVPGASNNANVLIYAKASDGSVLTTLSDTVGNYMIPSVPVGENYSIIASAHDLQTVKADGLEVTYGATTVVPTLTLLETPSNTGTIEGYARYNDVETLDHAGIIISVEGTSLEAISARDGSFIINDIPVNSDGTSKNYTLNFTESKYLAQTQTNLTVVQGATNYLDDVTLERKVGTIAGKVTNENEVALSSASVILVSDQGSYSIQTDSNGDFSLTVDSTTYTVTAMKDGYGSAQISNTNVDPGENVSLANLQLTTKTILGTIKLEGSETIAQDTLQVSITNVLDTEPKTIFTETNGDFSLNAIEPGNYKLTITHTTNSDYPVKTIDIYNVDENGYIFVQPITLTYKPIVKDSKLLTYSYIKGQNSTDINGVRYNLNLPSIMPNGSTVTWSSDAQELISNDGVVTLPLSTASNTVNLEATLSYSGESDITNTFNLQVVKEYTPYFKNNTASLDVSENFGYLFKAVEATNVNLETITYEIVSSTISENEEKLFKSLSINPNSGEISIQSQDNTYGAITFDVKASSGTPTLTDTISLTLNIHPVANIITDTTVSPNTLISLKPYDANSFSSAFSYSWSLTKPDGSTDTFSNSTTASPSFTPEKTGTYSVTLTMTSNAGITTDTETLTVLPTISVNDINVTEGNDALFTITISDHDNNVTLDYSTQDITAEVFTDYQKVSGSLTFAPNETNKTITVPVTVDYLPEGMEQFKLTLSNISGAIENSIEATASIEYEDLDMFYFTSINGFKIENTGESESSSRSVNKIGDLNNDGFDDFAVSGSKDQYVYVLFGHEEIGELGKIDLTGGILATDNAIRFTTSDSNVEFGKSVAAASDFNNDGIDDMMIGLPGNNEVYIIYGSSTNFLSAQEYDAKTFTGNPSQGFLINGDKIGYSIGSAGDFNGDNIDDVMVGAHSSNKVYIIYGGDSTAIALGSFDVSDAATESKRRLLSGSLNQAFGYDIDSLGDIDGDGYDDVVVGAYQGDYVKIFFGTTHAGTVQTTTIDGQYDLGRDVSNAGDVNGDGYNDILFSSYYRSRGTYVIFGKPSLKGNDLDITPLNAGTGFEIDLPNESFYGVSVGGKLDVNGDGYDDILIGDSFGTGRANDSGVVYCIYGSALLEQTNTVDVANINGDNGFIAKGVSVNDKTGDTIKSAGDINGDGYDDIITSNYSGNVASVIFGNNYNNVVDTKVTEGNSYTGTTESHIIVGDFGNEVFLGNGGNDIITAGAGNDTIETTLEFTKVRGGNGLDTLKFDISGEDINLSAFKPTQIEGIEILDISGDGPNNLLLDNASILNLSKSALANELTITGGNDDKVLFDDNGWSSTSSGGYRVYTNSSFGTNLSLKISENIPDVPTIIVENLTVNEDNAQASVKIMRTNGLFISSVDYEITDNTAQNGTDYNASTTTGTITFYENELIKELSIDLIQDDKLESDKLFSIHFDNLSNAAFEESSSSADINITIKDDLIDLAGLDGSNGFQVWPDTNYARFGSDVEGIGDFNGDGYEDFAISGNYNYSHLYIIYGSREITSESYFDTADFDGTNGAKITFYYMINNDIQKIGDFNGDGFDDILFTDLDDGDSYLIYGRDDLSSSQSYTSVTYTKISGSSNDNNKKTYGGSGDINGDGYDDIILADSTADPVSFNEGVAYIIFGDVNLTDITSIEDSISSIGVKITGNLSSGYLGYSNAIAGDVNGDGYDDILLGAYNTGYGKAYLIYGKENLSDIDLATFNTPSAGIVMSGNSGGDNFGISVSGAGDFNADGYADMIIGAGKDYSNSPIDGEAFLIYGSDSLSDMDLDSSPLNGTNGTRIYGNNSESLGYTVKGGGDINADSYDDIIIGSPEYENRKGNVYVIYGNSLSSANFDISTINPDYGFMIEGIGGTGTYYGRSLGINGDYNGDGFNDLLLGAQEDSQASSWGGIAYMINGRDFLGVEFYTGTSGDDSYSTYTSNNDRYYPLQGNDYVYYYSGPDQVYGGQGDDIIKGYGFTSDSSVGKIKGGKGFDTLGFAYGSTSLNFTSYKKGKIKGIEKLDLSSTTKNYTVTLATLTILNLLDSNQHTFYIDGTSNDSVIITDGTWTENTNDSDANYRTWELSNSPVKLKVENAIGSPTFQ